MLGYKQVPFHDLAWTWFVLVGTMICLVVGYGVSLITRNRISSVNTVKMAAD